MKTKKESGTKLCVCRLTVQKELTRTKLTNRMIRGTHAPFPVKKNINVCKIFNNRENIRSTIDT